MEKLNTVDGLVVSQKKEWGEILVGFEGKNKYAVLDTGGNELYMAVEEGGCSIARVDRGGNAPWAIGIALALGLAFIRIRERKSRA